MANPKPSNDFRNVSILARGPVLQAIQNRAEELDLSFGRAAMSLIEEAIEPRLGATPGAVLVNLEAASTDDLIDELVGRLARAGEAEAAINRAEAAEARLALVAAAMGGAPTK